MKVALEDDPEDAVLHGVKEGMRAFNRAAVPGLKKSQKITAAIRGDDGALLGGVIGQLGGDSVYMEVVWNDDSVRGTGLGREMMTLVEDRARELGAREAWLYTMSFQAKPFYEKLGYTQFAELPWLNGRHARHFMRKDL
jgi:GNAT superfamily N-acetyltransferase